MQGCGLKRQMNKWRMENLDPCEECWYFWHNQLDNPEIEARWPWEAQHTSFPDFGIQGNDFRVFQLTSCCIFGQHLCRVLTAGWYTCALYCLDYCGSLSDFAQSFPSFLPCQKQSWGSVHRSKWKLCVVGASLVIPASFSSSFLVPLAYATLLSEKIITHKVPALGFFKKKWD